jgi:hypothetical protein
MFPCYNPDHKGAKGTFDRRLQPISLGMSETTDEPCGLQLRASFGLLEFSRKGVKDLIRFS